LQKLFYLINTMKKFAFGAAIWLCASFGTGLCAQCHPDSLEIPNNGFDEDCDGLDDIYLKMAPYFYAVEGAPFSIHFPNLILSQHPGDYVFEVITAMDGNYDGDTWKWSGNDNAGEHLVVVKVKNPNGTELALDTMTVRVSPDEAPEDMSAKKLCMMGHGFFDQGYLPIRLWNLFQAGNNPPVTFHASKEAWGVISYIRHEGWGGYFARSFVNEPGSPFFLNGQKLNFRQYFENWVGPGETPDWVLIHLDIDDFCGYSLVAGDSLHTIDDSITNDWAIHQFRIIDSIRAAAPEAKIGICMSPPPSGLESAFEDTYGPNGLNIPVLNNRWRWKKIISRLVYKNIEVYGDREDENIYIIPEHIDLDDTIGYRTNDAIHPDRDACQSQIPCGYSTIGSEIYAWMRYLEFLPPPSNAAVVKAKVFLQGPYVSGETLMYDSLRVNSLIPLQEPYSALTNFTHTGGGGGEQTTADVLAVSGSDAIVDWVFVELRNAADPSEALYTRSALLQRDGDVVDTDGVSPVVFADAGGSSYYLSVRHRNHLGVELNQAKLYPANTTVETDFTHLPPEGFYSSNGLNAAQRALANSRYALWGGNGLPDNRIRYNGSQNDRNAVLSTVGLSTPNNIFTGYHLADYNLDGKVKYNGTANDRNVLLGNVGISTPSTTLYDQTPN